MNIDLYECGSCEKKITGNLIASHGADHHDPAETKCWDCFGDQLDSLQTV